MNAFHVPVATLANHNFFHNETGYLIQQQQPTDAMTIATWDQQQQQPLQVPNAHTFAKCAITMVDECAIFLGYNGTQQGLFEGFQILNHATMQPLNIVVANGPVYAKKFYIIFLSASKTCYLSCHNEYVALYASDNVYLWKIIKEEDSLMFDLLFTFAVFGQVHALLLTCLCEFCTVTFLASHVIVGKSGCVHLFNWRHVEKSKDSKDALGRCVFVPKSKQKRKDVDEKICGTILLQLI